MKGAPGKQVPGVPFSGGTSVQAAVVVTLMIRPGTVRDHSRRGDEVVSKSLLIKSDGSR